VYIYGFYYQQQSAADVDAVTSVPVLAVYSVQQVASAAQQAPRCAPRATSDTLHSAAASVPS